MGYVDRPLPDNVRDEINERVASAANAAGLSVGNLLRSKSQIATGYRWELMRRLREDYVCHQQIAGRGIFKTGEQPAGPGWIPLSTPWLAAIIGVDHSAVVLALRKMKHLTKKENQDDRPDEPDRINNQAVVIFSSVG